MIKKIYYTKNKKALSYKKVATPTTEEYRRIATQVLQENNILELKIDIQCAVDPVKNMRSFRKFQNQHLDTLVLDIIKKQIRYFNLSSDEKFRLQTFYDTFMKLDYPKPQPFFTSFAPATPTKQNYLLHGIFDAALILGEDDLAKLNEIAAIFFPEKTLLDVMIEDHPFWTDATSNSDDSTYTAIKKMSQILNTVKKDPDDATLQAKKELFDEKLEELNQQQYITQLKTKIAQLWKEIVPQIGQGDKVKIKAEIHKITTNNPAAVDRYRKIIDFLTTFR